VCQQNKTEQLQPVSLLQPLPVPTAVWSGIAMDFIKGLPKVSGKSVILTVVDRFSNVAHFIPLGHPVFTRKFWKELFAMARVQLQYSSAFHPQSDGQ
jgi:hypothetical protein